MCAGRKNMARIKKRILTVEEAKRGIYIDFEGFGSKPGSDEIPEPHMLGAWSTGFKKLYLLREHFAPLVHLPVRKHWDECEVMDIESMVLALIEWSKKENRLLLSFSIHEPEAIKQHCSKSTIKLFTNRFVNAKLTVNEWHKVCRRGKPRGKTLKWYWNYVGYNNQTPDTFSLTDSLKKIETAVNKTRRWNKLDKKIKDRWSELVMYNLQDCKLLRKLTVKAANGLQNALGGN
jgi:hypothetical protein